MKLEKFEELQETIQKCIEWSEETIEEMEMKLGRDYQSLVNIYFKEKLLTDSLVVQQKKLYSDLFKELENSDKAYPTKYEKEVEIFSNEEYYKKSLEVTKQKAILDWIEKSLENLKNVKFEIKDYMNWKLFKSGRTF